MSPPLRRSHLQPCPTRLGWDKAIKQTCAPIILLFTLLVSFGCTNKLPQPNQEVAIEAGGLQQYTFLATANEVLLFEVLQQDVDLKLEVQGNGTSHRADNYTGLWGREWLCIQMPQDGRVTLSIRAGDTSGRFTLAVHRYLDDPAMTRLAQLEPLLLHALENRDQVEAEETLAAMADAGLTLATARGRVEAMLTFGQTRTRAQELLEAGQLFHGEGHLGWARLAYAQAGRGFARAGAQQRALAALEDAVAMAEQSHNNDGLAKTLEIIAFNHRHAGSASAALPLFQRAAELYQSLGRSNKHLEMIIQQSICEALNGRTEQAQRLLEPLRNHPNEIGRRATLELAWANHLAGDHQRALERLQRQLENSHLSAQEKQRCADRLSSIYRKLGRFQEAEALNQTALALAQSNTDKITLHANRAEILTARGRYGEALEILKEAVPWFEALNRLEPQMHLSSLEAKCLLGLVEAGDHSLIPQAAETALEVIDLLERMRLATTHVAVDRDFIDLRGEYVADMVHILARLHQYKPKAGYDLKAWQTVARMRARGLRELLLLESEVTQHHDLKRLSAAIEQQTVSAGSSRDASMGDVPPLQSLLDQREQLRNSLTSRRAVQRQRLPDIAKVQAVLGTDVLLSYHLGAQESYLWLITANRFEMFPLPAKAHIEPDAKTLFDGLAQQGPIQEINHVAQRLGDLLLDPVLDQLLGHTVHVVKDGALHHVPFALLQPGGRTLDLAVAGQASGAVYALQKNLYQQRGKPPLPLLVFADPVFSPWDERLKDTEARRTQPQQTGVRGGAPLSRNRLYFSRQEAEAIKTLVPDAVVFSDFEVNQNNTRAEVLSRYQVVHFATHGIFDPEQTDLSGIQISAYDRQGRATKGVLRAYEWGPGQLPVDLVVLSACETARVRTYRGEGAWGLSQALMGAGAGAVVVSLWNVDDQAGAIFMTAFYRALVGEGMDKASALSAARAAVRATPGRRHPYYWAGFVLSGIP